MFGADLNTLIAVTTLLVVLAALGKIISKLGIFERDLSNLKSDVRGIKKQSGLVGFVYSELSEKYDKIIEIHKKEVDKNEGLEDSLHEEFTIFRHICRYLIESHRKKIKSIENFPDYQIKSELKKYRKISIDNIKKNIRESNFQAKTETAYKKYMTDILLIIGDKRKNDKEDRIIKRTKEHLSDTLTTIIDIAESSKKPDDEKKKASEPEPEKELSPGRLFRDHIAKGRLLEAAEIIQSIDPNNDMVLTIMGQINDYNEGNIFGHSKPEIKAGISNGLLKLYELVEKKNKK